jgi:hypothetical protein
MPRSLLLLLFLSFAPHGFALPVSPEIPLSETTIQPSALTRSGPRIASNGREFLVVWIDDLGQGIRGTRLDRDGTAIDETSFLIASGVSTTNLSVASDGTDFVVTYGCYDVRSQTCLAHVSGADAQVEPGGRINSSGDARIASNGRSYLVVYRDPNSQFARFLRAVEVSRDARTLGAPFELRSAITPYAPEIVSDGERYFVIWLSGNTLFGMLISSQEIVGPRQQFTHTNISWGPGAFGWSVAANGSGFMVVWQQNIGLDGNRYLTDLRTCPVSVDGVPGKERAIVSAPEIASSPAIIWNGSAYDVSYTASPTGFWPYNTWLQEMDIHRIEVDSAGQLVSGPAEVVTRPGSESSSAIASNGLSTVVTWETQNRLGAIEIESRRLFGGAPAVVSNSPAWQQSLAGTTLGDGAVVAWEELTGPLQRRVVVLQRLNSRALPIDGPGIPVAASLNEQLSPSVSRSFVAWIEQPLLDSGDAFALARRLSTDGRPSGPVLRLGPAARGARMAIVETRSQVLVAWESETHRIAGVRISSAGALLDRLPVMISPNKGKEWNPAIATDGNDFLVAWQLSEPWQCWFECVPPDSLHSALVTAQGTAGAQQDIASNYASVPIVVWNGQNYAVFWSGAEINEYPGGFRGRNVDRNGFALDAKPRRIADSAFASAVVWAGEDYRVAFNGRNPHGSEIDPSAAYLGRLDRELKLTRQLPLPVPPFPRSVVLLPRDDGSMLLAYPSFAIGQSSRAVARIVEDQSPARRRSN